MNMKPTPELINDWHEKARQMALQADGYFDDVEHWRHFAELAAAWGAEQAIKNHALLSALESAKSHMQDGKPHTLTMHITRKGDSLLADAVAVTKGAEQAQQTTDPLGFQIRRAIAAEDELRATKQTLEHAYAALQKVADAQAAIEEPELPEAVAWRWMYQDQPDSERCFNAPLPNTSVLAVAESAEFRRTVQAFYTATQMHDHYQAGVRAGMGQSQDAKRLDWLNQTLFMSKWNGVIDSGSKVTWSIAPDYRHTTLKMAGNTLREAIDAAMQGGQQ